MEGALKLARQVLFSHSFLVLYSIPNSSALKYFWQTGQPKRVNFIGRHLSFHGTTLGTLGVAYHAARRAPYIDILDTTHFHHVSPAYAKRFQKKGETEEEYVARLSKELDDKFTELGPDTVIGCKEIITFLGLY